MTEPTCEIYGAENYDGELGEFYHYEWRTARKPQTCGECGRTIGKKERYHRTAGKFDGKIITLLECAECKEIGDVFGEARAWGRLWDELDDQLATIKSPTHCMSMLKTPAAKKFFSERWLEARTGTD